MHTVVIIEPHPLFRLGLRQLLNDALPQLSVEGHDYTSLEASADSRPGTCDLLLLAVAPDRSSEQLAHAAVRCFSPRRILLMTDPEYVSGNDIALPDNVAGYVPKAAPPEILQASVRLVLAGGTCFPPSSNSTATRLELNDTPAAPTAAINLTTDPARYEPAKWGPPGASAPSIVASPVADSAPATPAAAEDAPETDECEFSAPMKPGSAAHRESQLLGLTPRQYEVLVLLARGYPMKKVGRALNISVATAKAHTETLYQRLDVHNRNAAVYEAVSRGATLGWARMKGEPTE